MGLRSKVARRFKRTTRQGAALTAKPCRDDLASPNLVNQEFTVTGPNKVWVSDITYVWTLEGWLYLMTVKDLWSRRVIGHAMTDHLLTEADASALAIALEHPCLTAVRARLTVT